MPEDNTTVSNGYTDLITEQSIPSEYASDVPMSDASVNWEKEVLNPKTDKMVAIDFFTEEWQTRNFPDDLLILNDIVFSNIPTNAISIESESNVRIAETLRSKAPIVSSTGIQDIVLNVTITFPQGPAQSQKLRRLIAEIQNHPLVYIYNGKIRKSIGVYDPITTTIFILESGTLRSDPDHVGSIILDMTLHYFNYKPFSHHFWYNTNFPWVNKPQSAQIDKELSLGDLSAYEASSYAIDYQAEKLAADLKSGTATLKLNNPNVPINMPLGSDAWSYYANFLEQSSNAILDENSDYVGFKLRAFEYISPPSEQESQGRGAIGDLFKNEDKSYRGVYSAYKELAIPKEVTNSTPTENAINKIKDPVTPGEYKALLTGIPWLAKRHELMYATGDPTVWFGRDKALSPIDPEKGETSGHFDGELLGIHGPAFKGSTKCNIHFCEVARRSGYKLPPLIKQGGGRSHYAAFGKGAYNLAKLVRLPSLDWGIRLTGQSAEEINKIIDSGVLVAVMNERHVVLLTHVNFIKYNTEKRVERISYTGYDQNKVEEFKNYWGGGNAWQVEVVQCIPTGTSPPYANPLGPPQLPPKAVTELAQIEEKLVRQDPGSNKNIAARLKWIRSKRSEGLNYYADDIKIRNVFYQNLEYHVSSNTQDAQIDELFGKDIVTSAISISFGHRIVPQRLLSQDTYTWQFLGAGNKTGTIVFTFSGEQGRMSSDRIKKLIIRARENARQFQGMIPEAGSIRLTHDSPAFLNGSDDPRRNTILALLNIDHVLVSDFAEANVPGTSDQHQLVVNFVAQDFAKEKLDRNIITDLDQKRRIIKSLMGYIKTKADNDLLPQKIFFYPDTKHVVLNDRRNLRTEGRPWRTNPKSDMPFWLAQALVKVATVCANINNELPDKTSIKEPTRDMFNQWGAGDAMVGLSKNIEYIDYGLGTTRTALSRGVPASRWDSAYGRPTIDRDDTANYSTWNRLYMKWLNSMDTIVEEVRRHACAQDFGKWFGSIGDEIVDGLVDHIGECYDDMMLPSVPYGNIPLSPDFYVYDDSDEDPAVSALTDDANMEILLQRHIRNSHVSINHYIKDTLVGGSYVSRNLPRIMNERREYLENFGGSNGELEFLSWGQRLQEGTFAWEPVFYKTADDRYSQQNSNYNSWLNRVSEGDNYVDRKKKFMDDIITLSPYLHSGRSEHWKTDSTIKDSDLIASIYDDNWDKLCFGPNPDYKNADTVLGGMPQTSSDLASSRKIKETHEDEANKKEEPLPDNAIRLNDNSVAFGDNEAEIQAINKEKFLSLVSSDLHSFLGYVGAAFDFFFNDAATNLTQNLIQKGKAQQEDKTLREDINKLLPGLDHEEAKKQFSTDKEVGTLAKMATSIGFGTKAKDLSIRRVYPTFKIYFIEDDAQGSEILNGTMVRAFDDFYSYSAVQEIRIIRSRKIAADLAVIRITNIGGKLLRRRFGEKSSFEQENENIAGINAEHETGIFADTELENPFEKMVLQDGVKVQIRLGYASNPDHLESVFLGSIVEISPQDDGKILEITCQGFGAELESIELGPLEDGPAFYSSQQMLSGAIIQDSIVSFGRRNRSNQFSPGEIRHSFTGGQGEGLLSSAAFSGYKKWGQSDLYRHYFKYPFRNYPQDDNIFAPPPALYASKWDRFWNNACTYRPLKQTPWQIFKEHELRHPGYISMAVPYGHAPRMTMFFGSRAQHYWSHAPSGLEVFLSESATEQIIRMQGLSAKDFASKDMTENLAKLSKTDPGIANAVIRGATTFSRPTDVSLEIGKLFGRYRPFRNFHYFDSKHHILRNNIRTSNDGVFNEVEVLYFKDENDIQESSAETLSENIIRMVNGYAGHLATKLDENIPPEHTVSYREEFPSCVTEMMAKRYTQGLFCRLLRDAYKGELYVLGEPTLKPYDVCFLNDSSINMTGPIEVEQVEHVFNRDHGFISIVTPDLCVDINDYYNASYIDLVASSMAYTFGSGDSDMSMSMSALASPLNTLALCAGVKFLKWTQEGTPVITTPLVFGGKPFMSVSLGQKKTSLFFAAHGRWRQYWDDLDVAWDKFDIAESMFNTKLSWSESIASFISGGPDAGDSAPLAE